ncbi:MAG: hypothetical protein ACLGJC_18450 [Alphaproteobacteria bacterium]
MNDELTAEEMAKFDGFDCRPASDPQNPIKAPRYLQELIAQRKAKIAAEAAAPSAAPSALAVRLPKLYRSSRKAVSRVTISVGEAGGPVSVSKLAMAGVRKRFAKEERGKRKKLYGAKSANGKNKRKFMADGAKLIERNPVDLTGFSPKE